LRFETSYRKEVFAYRISYRKDVLAVVTYNRKEVLAAWRIQVQATRKKPQEVVDLRTQKEVLARALFLGCTVHCDRQTIWPIGLGWLLLLKILYLTQNKSRE